MNRVATSSDVGTSHGVFVVLLVDEDVFLVRVDVTFLGNRDDVAKSNDVHYQSECADHHHHGRIGRHDGRIDCSAHNTVNGSLSARSVQLLNGGDAFGIENGKRSPAEPLDHL